MRRIVAIATLLVIAGSAVAADLPPRLAQAVERAEAADLPVEAVRSKALEGLAKGVPVERIGPVLDALVADLHAAKALLPQATTATWVGGARAIRAGASDEAVQLVAGVDGDGRGLHALADLLGLGLSEADSVRVVQAAGTTATPELEIARVATTAAAMVTRGNTPNQVAVNLLSGLSGSHAGVVSLPESGPGKNGNGNAYGLGKESKGKALGKQR